MIYGVLSVALLVACILMMFCRIYPYRIGHLERIRAYDAENCRWN